MTSSTRSTQDSDRLKVPRWGHQNRADKAAQILGTLEPFLETGWQCGTWADVGCGTGVIAASIANSVASVTGIDPVAYATWEQLRVEHPNLSLVEESFEQSRLTRAGTFDVVICNQVYEHVEDPEAMIGAIFDMLRPGGICYFAGPNFWFPIEPHVKLPFVHWVPRRLGQRLVRATGSEVVLDAHSVGIRRLMGWLSEFEVSDAVPSLLRFRRVSAPAPPKFSPRLHVPNGLVRVLRPVMPGFVLILRRPMPA